MRKAMLCFALLLCGFIASAQDISGSTNVGVPSDVYVFTDQSACPGGWTDVTSTFQGFYLGAKAATGNAGDTLGSAIATTTTDLTITATSSTPTISCTSSPNFVTTAGTVPACGDSPAPTSSTPTITVAAAANQRSELAPVVWMRICKRA